VVRAGGIVGNVPDLFAGPDLQHTGRLSRSADVEVCEPGMGVRASQECHLDYFVQGQILDVLSLATQ